MASGETIGLLAAAGMVVLLPLANGCAGGVPLETGDASMAPVGGAPSQPTVIPLDQAANSRIAYIVTDTGPNGTELNGTAGAIGKSSASIIADGVNASLTTPADIHDRSNVPRLGTGANPEVYQDAGGDIQVTRIADVDNDGTADDTFLTYSFNKPVTPSRTEMAAAYTGTRSDPAVVAALQARTSHTATYTGLGRVIGGTGTLPFDLNGTLGMTAKFAGPTTGIEGVISVPATPLTPSANPSGIDQVTFNGAITPGTSDYEISNIKLRRSGADYVTMTREAGVGSFFGPKAGGTIGVFSGTGKTADSSPSDVNVLGSFTGSTADNN